MKGKRGQIILGKQDKVQDGKKLTALKRRRTNEGGRFRGGLRRDEDWATGENVAQGAELKYEQKTLRFSGVEVKEERRGVVMQKTIIIMGFDQARGTRTGHCILSYNNDQSL